MRPMRLAGLCQASRLGRLMGNCHVESVAQAHSRDPEWVRALN